MSQYMIPRYHDQLRRARVSRTRQRDEIFLALSRLGPCTRHDLAKNMSDHANAATVYRTIAVFLDLGIAIEVRHKLVELSAPFKQHHHHLLCSSCCQEIGFNSAKLEAALREVAEGRLFTFDHNTHQVEITGICPMCQKK
jgi:Fur family ferric uptake transcriptional regulator